MWVPHKELKKIKKNKKKNVRYGGENQQTGERERGGDREIFFKKISLFASFSDLRKSDRQNSSG